jgi:membrane-bound lytic murein transglycosylase D
MALTARGSSAASAVAVCLALAPALIGSAARAASNTAAAKKPAGASRAATVPPPVEESASERRAVRGVPVDDGSESPELRDLRRFEEQAFPRSDPAKPGRESFGGDSAPAELGGVLRGHWSGSGDLPPEVRSPDSTARTSPPADDPDSDWLRTLRLPELPVRWDPQVLRYLDYFRADPKGHAVMAGWLRRAGRYRAMFEKTLDHYGLPRDLIYVAMIESGFDFTSRSRVGAGGIWQFMPSAARTYGLEISYWVDGRRDPERSADAAARYLKDLYVRFGNWPLVFAAYNAGYGAVLTSIGRYNTNDYWELCRHESGLPWESSIYVPKIMAAAIVGHNLEAFGFADVTPDAPYVFDRVDAPPGTTFASIARAAGTRPEVIASLNSQLLRERTPPDRAPTAVRIPVGTSTAFAEAFDRARGTADRVDTVVLRFGETIDEVARSRGLAPRELRKLNGVKDAGELRAGVTIVVPKRTAVAQKEKATDKNGAKGADAPDKPESDASDSSEDDQVIVAVPDRVFIYEGRERVFYRTRDGDSIEEIAETFAVLPDDLIEWNNLDPTAKLQPKLILQVYVRKDFDPAGVLIVDSSKVRVVTLGSEEFLELETARRGKRRVFYTAKSGDTLAKVGRRYGLTAGDLARINRFSYNTELHEGQKIVVYSPTGDAPREAAMGLTPEAKRSDSKRPASSPPHGKSSSLVAENGKKTGEKSERTEKSGGKSGEKSGEKSAGSSHAVTAHPTKPPPSKKK